MPHIFQLTSRFLPGWGGGAFFRLQVYERVGILFVGVYERVAKSVIWVCERSERANRFIKSGKRSIFVIDSI